MNRRRLFLVAAALLMLMLMVLIACTPTTAVPTTAATEESTMNEETETPATAVPQPEEPTPPEPYPSSEAEPTPQEPYPSSPEEGAAANPAVSVPENPMIPEQIEKAKASLADLLGIDAAKIDLVEYQSVTWRDGSLGCPRPGMAYTQALVEGYRIQLQAEGEQYDFHGAAGREPFYCPAAEGKLDGAVPPAPGQRD